MSHAQRYQISINETVEKFGRSINIFSSRGAEKALIRWDNYLRQKNEIGEKSSHPNNWLRVERRLRRRGENLLFMNRFFHPQFSNWLNRLSFASVAPPVLSVESAIKQKIRKHL